MPVRVVSVSVVMALALLGDSLLYVVLPLHAAVLGLSPFQTGVLLSANRLIRLLTNRGADRIMRRMRPGPLFVAATALAAVTTAAYGLVAHLPVPSTTGHLLSTGFLVFLLARIAWGLCFSALRLGCFMAVLGEAASGTRGRLMGLYSSISRSGSFVAVMAGGALFDVLGYEPVMLLMAAGTALAIPLAIWRGPEAAETRSEDRAPRNDQPRSPSNETARQADARGSALRAGRTGPAGSPLLAVKFAAFAQAFIARGVVTATLALFLRQNFGERFGPEGAISVATVGSWLIGVRWMSDIGLAAPLGALSDRLGRARMIGVWLVLAGAAISGLALAPALGAAIPLAAALFVSATGLGAALDAAAGDLAPAQRRSEVMSSYADWTDLGAALGPLLALSIASSAGLRPTYGGGALLLALAFAGIISAFRHPAASRGAIEPARQ